jgi:hypothetical protein
MNQVKEFKNKFIKDHPEFIEDVQSLYQLMLDEIEEGGSKENEIYLFMQSCEDLIN